MSPLGWGSGGCTGGGPSTMFLNLPFRNYREVQDWLEEMIDAMGVEMDILEDRYISTQARTNLLDPNYVSPTAAGSYFATGTQAPSLALTPDTVLDVLQAIAGLPFPTDTNLTALQKQALLKAAIAVANRKGTKRAVHSTVASIVNGAMMGFVTPPADMSIALGDGAPPPGYGSWVPASGTIGSSRPWIFGTARAVASKLAPGYGSVGVGYAQFRAGYSAAGEPVFPTGSRITPIQDEHLVTLVGWSRANFVSDSGGSINYEFATTSQLCDATGLAAGTFCNLVQDNIVVNNQSVYRLEIDYEYTNTTNVSVLGLFIVDDYDSKYYDATLGKWRSDGAGITAYLPPVSSRSRFAIDVPMQAAGANTRGTEKVSVGVAFTSDGTATTQTRYRVYRVGLYEEYSLATEQASTGNRTAWLPLVDALGPTTYSRTAGVTVIEPANASRSAYKTFDSAVAPFPYHAALSGRGFLSNSSWQNLLKGSNNFITDWTASNATRTASSVISPLLGETSPSAPLLAATGTNANISQASIVGNPASKSYIAGVWVKKLSADNVFTDVTLSLSSGATVKSQTFTLLQSQGWQLLPLSPQTFGVGDATALSFSIGWGAAASNGQIAVASSYVYDLNGKTAILYPPVIQTPVGATATLAASTLKALTSTVDSNVLHPFLLSRLVSVVRGGVSMKVVPTFSAGAEPSPIYLFDVGQDATHNRVTVRIVGNVLNIALWDSAANNTQYNLLLTTSSNPLVSNSATWRRDTAFFVRALWSETSVSLSASNGEANLGVTLPTTWTPSDASVSLFRIGQDITGAHQFDGIITDVEILSVGAPIS